MSWKRNCVNVSEPPVETDHYDHLAKGGNQGRVEMHLGNSETRIVSGERYICAASGAPIRYPDLLVALDAEPELYNGYDGIIRAGAGRFQTASSLAALARSIRNWASATVFSR